MGTLLRKRLVLLSFCLTVIAATVVTTLFLPERSEGQRPQRRGGGEKPEIEDTQRLNVYADNWFSLYINGELVAVDSIRFMPHNVISVDVFPKYPMTVAVMAKDNADAKTGMEYRNTQIGDGGFILKMGDGTVTGKHWKAKSFFHGPVNRDTRNPRVIHTQIPEDWMSVEFDDSDWKAAREFDEKTVRPKRPFYKHDFSGAKFIWADDLELDNTVVFRLKVDSPPDASIPKKFPIIESP